MLKVIESSGNDVEKYWPVLFANLLKTRNVGELLANIGSVSADSGPATGVTAEAVEEEAAAEEA